MVVTYPIDIDLANPGTPHRIHVKQGDVMSRCIDITLLENGSEWRIGKDTTAVIRYCAQNPDGMITRHGLYDTLEDGSPAYMILGNLISIIPIGEMTAQPGLVTVDVLLAEGAKKVSTFNFELYVHRAPNGQTEN
jgi:hypothetical protein